MGNHDLKNIRQGFIHRFEHVAMQMHIEVGKQRIYLCHINIFEALSDAGIGVRSHSAKRLYKMASETDWVSISPIPNKYTHDDEIGNEISLPCVSDDISEEQVTEVIATIEWEPEQKVKPIKRE